MGLESLPSSVGELSKLMFLRVGGYTSLPSRVLGKLMSVQDLHLGFVSINTCPNITVEVGKLTTLRTSSFVLRTRLTRVTNCWEAWEPPR
ncbi:hypothetical protein GUJ93_ZPchr0011g28078 [Zizania palustris]|uniref:Disease resistance R13L4/SHOC-2-like LRR domain-containing protein n=1 Tax=Zizania palustris TaxID=103762 RepID=A0A8J5WLT2_ZIZPA|nr:hypothetical protein GUJ93_ZPchr0011g28078 [Zizania palustris]